MNLVVGVDGTDAEQVLWLEKDGMTKVQELRRQADPCLGIVSPGNRGDYVVSLPPSLRAYQSELELLLTKVFTGRPQRSENLELARQMSLNWCMSKCRQVGISFEDSWSNLAAGSD